MMEKTEIVPVKDKDSDVEPAVINTIDLKEGQVGEVGGGDAADGLSRRLENRHIQLMAIGSAIGMHSIDHSKLSRLPYVLMYSFHRHCSFCYDWKWTRSRRARKPLHCIFRLQLGHGLHQ